MNELEYPAATPKRSHSLRLAHLFRKNSQRSNFQHKPLDLKSASIRQVELLSADESGIVKCKIRHATIGTRYTCVSYVCGPPRDTHTIVINRRPFSVRSNIWEFLRTVGAEIGSKQERVRDSTLLDFQAASKSLWIDALCIDQGNNTEKNHQVQRMGQIYSSGEKVIAWIGNNHQAAQLFRYMRESLKEQHHGFVMDQYMAMRKFCEDVYWKRARITQEVQLAPQSILLAEAESLNLELLVEEAHSCIDQFPGSREFWQHVEHTVNEQKRTIVADNMYRFAKKQCSDPLDLVYSILSMSTDGHRLQVEYGISKSQLMRKVLSLMVGYTCALRAAQVFQALSTTEIFGYGWVDCLVELELERIRVSDAGVCLNCSSYIALTSISLPIGRGRLYTHCLNCRHLNSTMDAGHILIAESLEPYRQPAEDLPTEIHTRLYHLSSSANRGRELPPSEYMYDSTAGSSRFVALALQQLYVIICNSTLSFAFSLRSEERTTSDCEPLSDWRLGDSGLPEIHFQQWV